jgi:hypothetical protein
MHPWVKTIVKNPRMNHILNHINNQIQTHNRMYYKESKVEPEPY